MIERNKLIDEKKVSNALKKAVMGKDMVKVVASNVNALGLTDFFAISPDCSTCRRFEWRITSHKFSPHFFQSSLSNPANFLKDEAIRTRDGTMITMLRPTEFMHLVEESSPYPIQVRQGFITTDKDGRTFLIDGYSGDLFAQPHVPSKQILERIRSKQCPGCFNYASPEAMFNCMHYVVEGYVHPVRICVVTEFQAGKMTKLMQANQVLGGVDYTPVQLKILAMLYAIHENKLPVDVQEKIDAVPSQDALRGGSCPYFASSRDVKAQLITRNITRQQRKRRFLDVLKGFLYLSSGHHAVGVSYFDRRIAELQNALHRIRAGSS